MKQSKEATLPRHSPQPLRLTQSCAFLGVTSKFSPAASFRQPNRSMMARLARQSPSPKHRFGPSKSNQGIFYLPEIPSTPVEKQKPEKAKDEKNVPKVTSKIRTRQVDGLQEFSLEATRSIWDLAAQEVRNGRHRPSHEEDRVRQASNTQGTNRFQTFVQQSGPGVPELSHRVGLPQQVAKEAAHLFQRFAEIPKGGTIFDGKLQISQLTQVLVALCDVSDASELDKKFAERAFRAADRDSGGYIDIEEFAIWYSSFCFAEEVTVRPQVRQTRELARQMGLEIWAIEKFRVAFDKYDADGSGEIEFDEFSDMVQELLKIPTGHELPHDRLMTMWRTADVQQKGYLDFREFCFFYCRMVSMEEGCDPIRDYYRNVRNVPVAPL